ncbi:MAG: methyltransferase domain-containing protein [Chloroflexi bacterium]|nr:methyltransferase domain-containing protein [Chloroflexota bacterium]
MITKRTLGWTAASLAAAGLLYAERDGLRSLLPTPTAPRIRTTYRYFAQVYNPAAWLMLFGQERPIRRRVVELAGLKPGDVVLDLACGTGANFPFILSHIGSTGKLIGLDYTPEMLHYAQEQIRSAGWSNVTLLRGDAAQLSLQQIAAVVPAATQGVDAVISTFAFCVIPGWEQALTRAVDVLKPGGRLVVGDVKLSKRPVMRPFNLVADLLGGAAAGDLGRRPWQRFPDLLGDVTFEERFFGFFYVASGCKQI